MTNILRQSSRPKQNDIIEPIKTLAKCLNPSPSSPIENLVWAKLEEYPWLPRKKF